MSIVNCNVRLLSLHVNFLFFTVCFWRWIFRKNTTLDCLCLTFSPCRAVTFQFYFFPFLSICSQYKAGMYLFLNLGRLKCMHTMMLWFTVKSKNKAQITKWCQEPLDWPVVLKGGWPWSVATAVSTSAVSSVKSANLEVKVTFPVWVFRSKYGEPSPEKLKQQKWKKKYI